MAMTGNFHWKNSLDKLGSESCKPGQRKQSQNLRLFASGKRGTKKVHVFKAWKQIVEAPKNRPSWMPEKINKPFVKKRKIETIE